MWIDEADSFAEIFRGYLPYYLLVALPIFIIISPANPVAASHEFPVYRMQQYDLHGVLHGCRSSSVNLEGRSLAGWSTSRHCIVTRLQDMTVDHFLEIRAKGGALLLLMPNDMNNLTDLERENILLLENAMAVQDTSIPVYFVPWSPEMNVIVQELASSYTKDEKTGSATDALFNLASANGYQIVISGASPVRQESKVTTIHGQLMGQESGNVKGNKDSKKVPTIAVVAHYDSAAGAPELAQGGDSNASGVAVLLELARIFSQLYSSTSTRGSVNIMFLLTGAARMNYYSTKKWIEDQLDSVDGSTMQDTAFVLCLDSLSNGDSIIMHVSKPPKEGSPTSVLYKQLKQAAAVQGSITVDGMHKKINLADENLAWEHERFSIRRLPAFTLSGLKTHKAFSRSSILDVKDNVNMKTLSANTQIIAESLAGYIYNVSLSDYNAIFKDSLKVDTASLESWIKYLTSQPRATQFVSQANSPLVGALTDALSRYLPNVATSHYVPDKRDPEFSTYTPTSATLNIYNVKPAVFDLILTVVIIAYLGLVYLFILKFPFFYSQICKLSVDTSGNYKSYKMQ